MTTGAAAEILDPATALERLGRSDASEAFSPLTGSALLVVGFDKAPRSALRRALIEARPRFAALPCPSVALLQGARGRATDEALAAFDLVLDDERDLEPVRSRVERAPLAALALVQLLRHNERCPPGEGLVMESLVYSTLQSGPEFARWLAERPARTPPAPASRSPLCVERHGDRLELVLDRPEKRNAFSVAMRDALVEALRLVCDDSSLREVVLRGRGPCFCSGGDLDEFGTLPDPATAHAVRSTRNAARLLAECAERIRAEVHGACVGAGIELAAFARRVHAREDAFFRLPEIEMGLVPGSGGTVSLPRRIGRQRTAYLALSAQPIDAASALRWGLVDEIVP